MNVYIVNSRVNPYYTNLLSKFKSKKGKNKQAIVEFQTGGIRRKTYVS